MKPSYLSISIVRKNQYTTVYKAHISLGSPSLMFISFVSASLQNLLYQNSYLVLPYCWMLDLLIVEQTLLVFPWYNSDQIAAKYIFRIMYGSGDLKTFTGYKHCSLVHSQVDVDIATHIDIYDDGPERRYAIFLTLCIILQI